jgi:hypothetical protein
MSENGSAVVLEDQQRIFRLIFVVYIPPSPIITVFPFMYNRVSLPSVLRI